MNMCSEHPNAGLSFSTKLILVNPFSDNDLKYDCYVHTTCGKCGKLLHSNADEAMERVRIARESEREK